jgi:hypothetical protein
MNKATSLIRSDTNWWYLGNGGEPAVRWLRVYQTGPAELAAFITEAGDGTSITNAAESIHEQLAIEHPGCAIHQFEHWPAARGGESAPYIDEVAFPKSAEPMWRRVGRAELVRRIGPEVLQEFDLGDATGALGRSSPTAFPRPAGGNPSPGPGEDPPPPPGRQPGRHRRH